MSNAERGGVGMPHTPTYVADEEAIFVGAEVMATVFLDLFELRAIDEAPFLTEEQKRKILYGNAARFLRLSDEEMARHREK